MPSLTEPPPFPSLVCHISLQSQHTPLAGNFFSAFPSLIYRQTLFFSTRNTILSVMRGNLFYSMHQLAAVILRPHFPVAHWNLPEAHALHLPSIPVLIVIIETPSWGSR